MISNIFDIEKILAIDKSPVCYLFQFLVQGFIRVYSKDIYQHRLSNVLLSKTGASGIRTALLTLSAEAHKKKNVTSDSTTNSQAVPVEKCLCICGREFTGNGWLARHIVSCSIYLNAKIQRLSIFLLTYRLSIWKTSLKWKISKIWVVFLVIMTCKL